MPKLIDYPRTTYSGAWELAEIVDDTGGKCAIETAARKLDRKVSGSFKAIIGSAVKFGLMTSKRELLSTTTLFKRIKHAYDKQEELQFHREAFLTPPLFTQVCRKFRGRELPVQMLDVILIREFAVEEINAQGVAKAFVEGARMCNILDERNMMADIDALNAQRPLRREIASITPATNTFVQGQIVPTLASQPASEIYKSDAGSQTTDNLQIDIPIPEDKQENLHRPIQQSAQYIRGVRENDAIADLFGLSKNVNLNDSTTEDFILKEHPGRKQQEDNEIHHTPALETMVQGKAEKSPASFQIQISGPGINTVLDITHEEDITIAIALMEKIRRQLRTAQ
ncbi:hypothetical protein [Hymenobacter daeguensis]